MDAITVYVSSTTLEVKHIIGNLSRVYLTVLLASLPDVPIPARWTKVFCSLQWFWPGFAVHGLLPKCFSMAFDGNADPSGTSAETNIVDDLGEASHVGSLDDLGSRDAWQKELGKRLGRGMAFVRDPFVPFQLCLLTTMLHPLNFISAWMLRVMSERSANPLSWDVPSIIMDLKFPKTSPALLVRQYYSSMLKCPMSEGPFCVLAKHARPMSTELCSMIFKLLLVADAGLFIRFTLALEKWPFFLLGLVDARRTDTSVIAEAVVATRRCCVDSGATEKILDYLDGLPDGRRVAGVQSMDMQALLRNIARALDGAIDDLEVRHARNKRDSAGHGEASLSARYTLREAVTQHESYCPSTTTMDGRLSIRHAAPTRHKSQRQNAVSLYHCVQARVRALLKRCGASLELLSNPVSSRAWSHTRDEWSKMPANETARWQELACLVNDGAIGVDGIAGEILSEQLEDEKLEQTEPCRALVPSASSALHTRIRRASDVDARDTDAQTCSIRPTAPITEDELESVDISCLWNSWSSHANCMGCVPLDFDMVECTKRCCQDVGACKRQWQTHHRQDFRRFQAFKQKLNEFLRGFSPQRSLVLRSLLLELLLFEGLTDGIVRQSRVAWIAFANGSPIFQVFVACDFVPPALTTPGFPFYVEPCCMPRVASSLKQVSSFPSEHGVLDTHKSTAWAEKCLLSPLVPLGRDSVWRVARLNYRPAILDNRDVPLGQLLVHGMIGEPCVIDCFIERKKGPTTGVDDGLDGDRDLTDFEVSLLQQLEGLGSLGQQQRPQGRHERHEREHDAGSDLESPCEPDKPDADVEGDDLDDFSNGALDAQLTAVAAELSTAVDNMDKVLETGHDGTFPAPDHDPAASSSSGPAPAADPIEVWIDEANPQSPVRTLTCHLALPVFFFDCDMN